MIDILCISGEHNSSEEIHKAVVGIGFLLVHLFASHASVPHLVRLDIYIVHWLLSLVLMKGSFLLFIETQSRIFAVNT